MEPFRLDGTILFLLRGRMLISELIIALEQAKEVLGDVSVWANECYCPSVSKVSGVDVSYKKMVFIEVEGD